MNYIIDGHNLISKTAGLSLSMPDDEQRLIELLLHFSQTGKKRIEVFFDKAPIGLAGEQSYGRVRAHFVQYNLTADQAIRNKLHALQRSSRNWVVVSSDRSVQQAAHEAHAGVLSAEEFANLLQASLLGAAESTEVPEKPLIEMEVDEWMKVFRSKHKKK